MRVLLTSFEPFGGHDRNSSLEVADALLATPPPGMEFHSTVLPVVAGACVDEAWHQIEQCKPHLILLLGQAGGSLHIRLEDRAVNRDHFVLPDNAGVTRDDQPVIAGAPPWLPAGVPLEPILISVRRLGFRVLHSLSAGTYVCNHLYYHLLYRATQHGRPYNTLFVHLPYLPGQVPVGAFSAAVALSTQVDCVRAILAACLEHSSS